MNFRRTRLAVLSSALLLAASAARADNSLVLTYAAQEGLTGHHAKGATFKAWIDGGTPTVSQTDDEGRVVLDLGRPLAKGQTLFVEAESADGQRAYSWIYRDSALSGAVASTCQLVGLQDFRSADSRTAQRTE